MPEGYHHLTQEDRYQIAGLKKSGFSMDKIAKEIGVHRSTLYRETKRNASQRGYRPVCAEKLATARHCQALRSRPKKISGDVQTQVESWLKEKQWSPDEISAKLLETYDICISYETIYQHIWDEKGRNTRNGAANMLDAAISLVGSISQSVQPLWRKKDG
jgi:IS30 family transposase